MNFINRFSAVFLAVLGIACCCGCGSRQKPKLVMETEATFPPYEYFEADGTTVNGIDPELMKIIADELGYELVIEPASFDHILNDVEKGDCDVGASGITVTEERKKRVDFTIPYAATRQVIVVPMDSVIKTPADLKGKSIGVQRGSTGDDFVTKNIQEPARIANGEIAFDLLTAGKLDAVVLDEAPARIHQMKYKKLKILDMALTKEEYAFAIRKGRPELVNKMNAIIKRLSEDRTIARITAKHKQLTEKKKEQNVAMPVLHAGFDPAFPPYEFQKNNKIVGIDPDILQKVASEMGYDLIMEKMPFDSMVDDIRDGKADIGASSISITPERKEKVEFTIPYLTSEQAAMVSGKSGIKKLVQLKGKRIGVIYGATSEKLVLASYGEPERYSDAEKMVADLAAGQLDAVIMDRDPAELLKKRYQDLVILPEALQKEQYGFILRKGRKELVEKMNRIIERMISDGTIRQIREKYMNDETFP